MEIVRKEIRYESMFELDVDSTVVKYTIRYNGSEDIFIGQSQNGIIVMPRGFGMYDIWAMRSRVGEKNFQQVAKELDMKLQEFLKLLNE